jgi:hypothetical protein
VTKTPNDEGKRRRGLKPERLKLEEEDWGDAARKSLRKEGDAPSSEGEEKDALETMDDDT